jgi:hypothetical protein
MVLATVAFSGKVPLMTPPRITPGLLWAAFRAGAGEYSRDVNS